MIITTFTFSPLAFIQGYIDAILVVFPFNHPRREYLYADIYVLSRRGGKR